MDKSVVGYISNDGDLGRTFIIENGDEDALSRAVLELTTDCNEPELYMEIFSDLRNNSSAHTDFGTYFHGGLEAI